MVAVDQNFRARCERRRKTTAHFIHRSAASAALCEGCGWDGNSNRIPKGGSCPIGISASLPQTRRLVPYPIVISPSMAQGRFSQRNDCGGTQPISDYLYQGMTLDAVTGLYYARNRNYSPSIGVWISQDPAQYINGANTYQMEMSGPVGAVDPGGLAMPAVAPFVMGSSDLTALAHSIENNLKNKANQGYDGWKPEVARGYVSAMMTEQHAGSLTHQVGNWLLTVPYQIPKDVTGEGVALRLLKRIGKRAANKLLKQFLQKLHDKGMQVYAEGWSGSLTDKTRSLCVHVSAQLFYVYDPKTLSFQGFISGTVGHVLDSFFPLPSQTTHDFAYPFSGKISTQQWGFWGFAPFGGKQFKAIVPGTWRYNGGLD